MNRSDVQSRVAERRGLGSPEAKGAADEVFAVIAEALASSEEARISGFGVFGSRERPARTGAQPARTAESMSTAVSTEPTFKPGKALRDAVNTESGV